MCVFTAEEETDVSIKGAEQPLIRNQREARKSNEKKKGQNKPSKKGKIKGQKKRKNKSKKQNKSAKKKNRGRKNAGKGRKERKKGKKSQKIKNKSRSGKKSKGCARQSNTTNTTDTSDCFQSLCDKTKKFNKYQTELRKLLRIERWVETMGKKKEKAATTFSNASNAIKSSTSNKKCDGASIPEEASTADTKLEKCNSTATDLCTSSKIERLDTDLIASCKPKLEKYVKDFKEALKNCDCTTIKALELVDASCAFSDMEASTKTAKKKCTSPTEPGSFGDCRQQERKVAYFGEKCKPKCGSTATKAPTSRRMAMFLQNKVNRK